MKFSTKATIVAALSAAFVFAGPSAYAGRTWAMGDHGKQDDPCPGQHVQVYVEGNYNPNSHFVCGTVVISKGEKGDKGETGPAGPQGPAGADGKDGAVGPVGPAGADGAAGIDGAPGADGSDGVDGRDGIDGLPGKPGDPGTNGIDGAAGPAGPAGVAGPVGPQGEKGEATSSTGARGPAGPAGKDGVTKYIMVNPDGTTETVDELPHTGSGNEWLIALIALGLIGAGTTAVVLYRKRP